MTVSRDGLTRAELLALPVTVDVPTAARALGLGRSTAYELARRDEFPCRVLCIGSSYRVPTADLMRVLGIEPPRRSSVAREPIKKITLKSGEVRYRFVTDAPRGPDGKRRQITHTFDAMREARDALAKIRAESSTGRYVHPDKTTLDEYLSEWLVAIGRGVEPGTLRAYQDALRVPREQLGHRKLQSIGTADVNAVVDFMLTMGRKKGGPAGTGLGARSVQMMLTVLRRAFQEAVRDRKMAWNPAEGVRGPRLRPRKVTPWTDDEVRAFMNTARRDRLHAIWRLSLLALRPEEVAGLRWDSVDLTACTLTVTACR